MQAAEAHPSLIYHRHPHQERLVSWEDGFLLVALLTLAWVLRPARRKAKRKVS
jgi:hypothetical protein